MCVIFIAPEKLSWAHVDIQKIFVIMGDCLSQGVDSAHMISTSGFVVHMFSVTLPLYLETIIDNI